MSNSAAPIAQAATISIRRPRLSDAQAVASYMAHADVFGNLLQLPHPSEEAWTERLKNPPPESFSLVVEVNGQLAGMAGLFPDKGGLRRRHCLHLGISVAVAHQGVGAGNALMTELLSYADNWANCLRIELEVFSDNARAIAMYLKHGFVIEGTKRCDSLQGGRYANSHVMGRLHPSQPLLTA